MTTTTLEPRAYNAVDGDTRVALNAVSKRFGSGDNGVLALDRISLQVRTGEFVCLVGASGCGKTTLLNLVAGLDHPSSGEVVRSGKAGLMFQEAALFPWLGRPVLAFEVERRVAAGAPHGPVPLQQVRAADDTDEPAGGHHRHAPDPVQPHECDHLPGRRLVAGAIVVDGARDPRATADEVFSIFAREVADMER